MAVENKKPPWVVWWAQVKVEASPSHTGPNLPGCYLLMQFGWSGWPAHGCTHAEVCGPAGASEGQQGRV